MHQLMPSLLSMRGSARRMKPYFSTKTGTLGSGGNDDMMQRHRDRLGAIYRVVGFDGNGVQCVLYHRTDQGGFVEREHSQSWPDFLEDLQGEVECPLPQR